MPNKDGALKTLDNLRLRLLDLTSRNRLINFRHTEKGSLRIIDELPNQLVETLLTENATSASGWKEMRFRPVPEPTRNELVKAGYIKIDEKTEQEIRLMGNPAADEWAKQLGMDISYEVPTPLATVGDGRHSDNCMQTLLYPYELEARLKNLMQTSESAIQEMGANILYLAFGFLEWFESNNDNSHIAPLFLVPVRLQKGKLNRKTKTYEYTVNYSGEDIIPNLSLREKLRADFALALPDLDEDSDPEFYFNKVLALIKKNQPRWRVRRYITLTLLNFSKLLMYLDLDPSRWSKGTSIIDHPVVGRFLAGGNDEQEQDNRGLGFGEEYPIDELENIHAKYPLIDDADSSQHSALVDAVDGKNLVIEGPPGTGKSQTITNLIAAAMAQGKRVLFVAEKLAALEVVRRRLDAAGLGEFCLELHSHKTQKRKVLEEIGSRIKKHHRYPMPRDIELEIKRYEKLKKDLKEHVERINRVWKSTGKTLHEIFMAATRYREAIGINPDFLRPEGYDGDNFDIETQRRIDDRVEAFGKVYQAVAEQLDAEPEMNRHPWYGVRNTDLQIFDLSHVVSALQAWQHSLQSLDKEIANFTSSLSCGMDSVPKSLSGLLLLIENLERLPSLNGNELLDLLPVLRGKALDKAQQHLKLFEDIQTRYAELADTVGPDVLHDLAAVDGFLAGSRQLRQLVGEAVRLGELGEAIKRLKTIQDELAKVAGPLSEIHSAVGKDGTGHLLPTEAGLRELTIFIDLVAGLNPSYLRLRDERFDNDELDDLLPKLRAEIEKLYTFKVELEGVFRLDVLPENSVLRRIRETIDDGGVFRWLKSGWRSARKQAVGFAANNQVAFSRLYPLLGKAEEYAERRDKLNGNGDYREALGDHFKGLETDLVAMEALRNWYKNVRRQYGVGFGQRVALGNAILCLPQGIAKAIRSLNEQGVQGQLLELLNAFGSIKNIFTPFTEMRSVKAQLVGEESVISKLLALLNESLLSCKPLIVDDAISIGELANRIEGLDSHRRYVSAWEKADYGDKLFKGRISLNLGLNVDNTSSLSVLRNTLVMADCIDRKLANENVRQRIYDLPEASIFLTIKALADRLRALIEEQRSNYLVFEQLTVLDRDSWLTSDLLNELIARNSRALENPDTVKNWLDYARVREHLVSIGFVRLVTAVEKGEIDLRQVDNACKAAVYGLLAREILSMHAELGRFSGRSQEVIQGQFRECDNQLKKLQCQKISYQIDPVDIPAGNNAVRVSELTELTLLKHECSKQTRHLPIRQLLQRAGRAMVALKPCFMMGPMSVAQYLEPGQIEFDLVVMDEASQIKPEDA
ncbi:MAG: DUF4011 domain-containing protein, partial [Nitrospinae bacterium]|nr:DUF4011 domain-containing protein [Nitrospinota bacterium]